MLRIKSLRALLLLPAAFAVALLAHVSTASAATVADATAAINAKLAGYAADETFGTPANETISNASADDLVFAVYSALHDGSNLTSDSDIGLVAQAALTGRADANTLVSRIIDAAIQGSNSSSSATRIANIVTDATMPTTSLTVAGQELAVAQGLKSADPATNVGTLLGAQASALSANVTGQSHDLQEAFFLYGVAAAVGTNVNSLPTFSQRVLDDVSSANQTSYAVGVASGLSNNPAAAGAVIGGRALELTSGGKTTASDTALDTLMSTALANSAVKSSIGEVVANVYSQYTTTTPISDRAATLAANQSAAVKGEIASGAIRAAGGGSANTNTVITKILAVNSGEAFTDANKPVFAGQAAVNNSANAGSITAAVVNSLSNKTAFNYEVTGLYVAGYAGLQNPFTARDVAHALVDNGASLFNSSTSQQQLASFLAQYSGTSVDTAGSLVAGVVDRYATAQGVLATPASIADFTAAAINSNLGASAQIAREVASNAKVSADPVTFVGELVSKVTPAQAALIAVGVAYTNPTQAGPITAKVINTNSQSFGASIAVAATVASVVDLEQVANVADAVSAIYTANTTNANLPQKSFIPTLAYYVAKGINFDLHRDLGASDIYNGTDNGGVNHANNVRTQHNRADEFGEVMAVLTNNILKAGVDSTTPTLLYNTIGELYLGSSFNVLKPNSQSGSAPSTVADIKDIASDVAGALAQSIYFYANTTLTLTPAQKQAMLDLLSPTGPLLTALDKAAGPTYQGLIDVPFHNVRDLSGIDFIYHGSTQETISNNNGVTTFTGTYEIGSYIDPETPIKNI